MKEIILASASPRRKELLEQIGIPFRIIKSDAKEIVTEKDPVSIGKELSARKAEDVATQIENGIVLGADTLVFLGEEIMGKPSGRQEAYDMLMRLQGNTHLVCTGVTLIERNNGKTVQSRSFAEVTKVQVSPMSDEEINAYLDTGDASDKAGSYGIQGPFAAYVQGIEGDYHNVVGLPVCAVYHELKNFFAIQEALS